MNVRIVLISAAITAASAVSAYAGCAFHDKQAMSCAEGSTYDPESNTCVPLTSS
ncbi:MAG: hypothetical protein K8F31_05190 [Roseovarius sp.]|nr:hypothetical protein [Roseovarius sp.]